MPSHWRHITIRRGFAPPRRFNTSNAVGYNTTQVGEFDTWQFIGASFEALGDGGFIPLKDLTCEEGFVDGDQVQMSSVDEFGNLQFKTYEYWEGDGWMDLDQSSYAGDTVGFELGKGAWFISAAPKHIKTAGQVKKNFHVHTFQESWSVNVSAYPVSFCPNSANISWGVQDGDQIQTASVDENGNLQFHTYEYWDGDGWADLETSSPIDADTVVVTPGKGFWMILKDPQNSSFTEVSPIAD